LWIVSRKYQTVQKLKLCRIFRWDHPEFPWKFCSNLGNTVADSDKQLIDATCIFEWLCSQLYLRFFHNGSIHESHKQSDCLYHTINVSLFCQNITTCQRNTVKCRSFLPGFRIWQFHGISSIRVLLNFAQFLDDKNVSAFLLSWRSK